MHINSLRMLARKVDADKEYGGKDTRVVIKSSPYGTPVYIGRSGKFSESKKENAFVYLYDTDGVSAQLMACAEQALLIEVEPA